jgi:hypothetical protein
MAKSTRSSTKTAGQNGELRAEPAADVEMPDALSYLNNLSQSGSEIEWDIRVYRVMGSAGRGGGSQPFLRNVNFDELKDLEAELADAYPMGGRFRVIVRADGRVAKSVMMDIAPRPGWREPRPQSFTPQADQTQLAATPPARDRLELVLEMMMKQQQQFMEAITARLAVPAAPAVDAQTIISNTMGMFRSFQEAMPKTGADNIIGVLTQGIELGKSLAGGGGDGDGEKGGGLTGLAGKFMESDLGKAIAAQIMNQQQRTPVPALAAPAAPVIVAPAPAVGHDHFDGGARVSEINKAAEEMNAAMQFLFA